LGEEGCQRSGARNLSEIKRFRSLDVGLQRLGERNGNWKAGQVMTGANLLTGMTAAAARRTAKKPNFPPHSRDS
jgi:hypothetical protein